MGWSRVGGSPLGLGAALREGVLGPQISQCVFLFQSEYHYEYTVCDSSGSRWRVAVPHTPGLCTGLPDPVRGTECCKAGGGGQVGGSGVREGEMRTRRRRGASRRRAASHHLLQRR